MPVTAAVESPFASATADNTKKLTQQTDDTNTLLSKIADTLASIAGDAATGNDFLNALRNYG